MASNNQDTSTPTGQFWFRPLTSKAKRREILAFDVEGVGGPEGFVCGSIVGDSLYSFYTDRESFWESLRQRGSHGAWLVAHNLEYDLPIAAGKDLWNGELTFTDRGLLKADFRVRDRKARFIDSHNLFPRWSVDDLGRFTGLPKLDEGADLISLISRGARWADLDSDQREKLRSYNLRDSEIVHRAVTELQEFLLSLGAKLQMTIAACAMDLFRRQHLNSTWKRMGPETAKLARPAFYGGRVENFMMGTVDNASLYDINSLYPHVQAQANYPHPNRLELATEGELWTLIDRWEGVAHVTIEVPPSYVPPLPWRAADKLFFPTGTLAGTWTLVELRAALKRSARLQSIEWVLGSPVTFSPFEQYVETLYEERKLAAADGAGRELLAKLLLNSLYGRFGLDPTRGLHHVIPLQGEPNFKELQGYTSHEMNGELIAYGPIKDLPTPPYANVLIAAQVTAEARLELLRELERQDTDLIYCDTDSVLTRGELPQGEGLGEWKQQMENGSADMLGPKEYILHNHFFNDRYVVKGVPERVARQYIKDGTARFRRAVRVREALRTRQDPSIWIEQIQTHRPTLPKRLPALADWHQEGDFVLTLPWNADQLLEWSKYPGDLQRRLAPRPKREYHPEWVAAIAERLGVAPEQMRIPEGAGDLHS